VDRTITSEVREPGIAFFTFDRPGSAANIFDQATFEQLNTLLDQVESDSTVRGLVIVSAKPKIFIAGADLTGFSKDPSPDDLAKIIDLGQRTFDQIANLKFPTVAAIHGVALGGGLEIALACDYRIASLDSATKLGLPETTLGIIPAWGGCTRLPRLVGLPVALEVILSGKQIPTRQAQKLGLVDDSTYRERLEDLATKKIVNSQGRKRETKTHFSNVAPLARIIADRSNKKTIEKTRFHYPAHLKSLDVIVKVLKSPTAVSLENEKKSLI
jgi:3-hydroxyacyl-CoA dehydrogenase / enoyl-CoA hydratase / 3-hydroxybutyryl-CoA epimerase